MAVSGEPFVSVPIHRPSWPSLFCPAGGLNGAHEWEFTAGSFFCVSCGGEVAAEDRRAIWRWWGYIQQVTTSTAFWN